MVSVETLANFGAAQVAENFVAYLNNPDGVKIMSDKGLIWTWEIDLERDILPLHL